MAGAHAPCALLASLALVVLACAGQEPRPFVPEAVAPPAPRARWDPPRVAAYAAELAEAARILKDAAAHGEAPTREYLSVPQQRAQYEFRVAVRLLSHTTAELAEELERGRDRAETTPLFRRIQALRRDIEETSQQALIDEAVLDEILHTGDALFKLIPYYEAD